VEAIFHLILKLKENRPYLRICRIFCLVMVTIGAIGCTGEWIIAFEPDSFTCTMGKFACYQGPPLTLPELVFEQGASIVLFMIPVLYLLAALLLLFKPPRAFTGIVVIVGAMYVAQRFAEPVQYLHKLNGIGQSLHMTTSIVLLLLSVPMAINELADPDFLEDFEEAERLRRAKDGVEW
jgi:hypothetical protein